MLTVTYSDSAQNESWPIWAFPAGKDPPGVVETYFWRSFDVITNFWKKKKIQIFAQELHRNLVSITLHRNHTGILTVPYSDYAQNESWPIWAFPAGEDPPGVVDT